MSSIGQLGVSLHRLLWLRELQDHPVALSRLYRRQLAVPLINQRATVFDTAQFQELRRQRILPNAVGVGLALRPSHQRLGLPFGLRDFLSGFRLRRRQLVSSLLRLLNRLRL